MAEHYTDFSDWTDYTDLLTDWSAGTDDNWDLITDTGTTGDQFVRLLTTAGSGLKYLLWTDLGTFEDTEIVFKVRAASTGNIMRCFLRSDATADNCYFVRHNDDALSIGKYTGGSFSTIGSSHTYSISTNTFYWIRYRAEGTNLKAKIWADGDSEPSGWDIEETDTDHSSGYVGLGSWDSEEQDFDVLGVGTDGDSAPMEEPVYLGATLDPSETSFNLDDPGDLNFDITWEEGTEVTNVTGEGITSGDWSVANDVLTINQDFLEGFNNGDVLNLTVEFDAGDPFYLTINVVPLVGTWQSLPYSLEEIENVMSTLMDWEQELPTGTSATVFTAVTPTGQSPAAEDWVEQPYAEESQDIQSIDEGENLTANDLHIKAELETTDTAVTPSVGNMWFEIVDEIDEHLFRLEMYELNAREDLGGGRFNNVIGDLAVEYDGVAGDLVGDGGGVESFLEIFTPTDLEWVPDVYWIETINATLTDYTLDFIRVYYVDGYTEETLSATLTDYTLVLTHVDDLDP